MSPPSHFSPRLTLDKLEHNLAKRPKSLNQINFRRCVACKKTAPKSYFWRVVRVGASRVIQLDEGMGRSAYLCPNLDCLREAKKKNRFQSALRTKVNPNIYQSLHERLS